MPVLSVLGDRTIRDCGILAVAEKKNQLMGSRKCEVLVQAPVNPLSLNLWISRYVSENLEPAALCSFMNVKRAALRGTLPLCSASQTPFLFAEGGMIPSSKNPLCISEYLLPVGLGQFLLDRERYVDSVNTTGQMCIPF